MTAMTTKDTFKAVAAIFSAIEIPSSLPPEVLLTIESFLTSHQEQDDRVHDELLTIYNKYVVGEPQKRALFLQLLRMLQPAIQNEKHLTDWWNSIIRPTLCIIGHRREEIEDAREFLLGILVFDPEDDTTGEIAQRSMQFSKALVEEYLVHIKTFATEGSRSIREEEFVIRELESTITTYGRKKPKELLLILDEFFVQLQYSTQILRLLSAFIQTHPPHLHLILHTPLWENIQRCLMTETSSTTIELALTVLIMLLPYTASNLVPYLPKLYLIYARILCWDKFQASPSTPGDDGRHLSASQTPMPIPLPDDSLDGEKLPRSLDRPHLTAPCVTHYFTFLYGLFPFNFLSFVRKPRKWLKKMEFPSADDFDIDQELLHARTRLFQQAHLLHPNFYTTTLEDELEENNWLKSDPADVVTYCMGLSVMLPNVFKHPTPPGPPPSEKLPELPPSHSPSGESKSLGVHGTKRVELDSPTLPAQKLQDNVSTVSIAHSTSATPVLEKPNVSDDTCTQTTLNIPTCPAFQPSGQSSGSITLDYLQREIVLLRNDLHFERYLKQQHLLHIGQLKRQHLKEVTVEAETQTIINTNRTLKAKLSKANDLYTQLKKEMATSRNQSKKWEGELSAKIRVFREEQKKWRFDEQTLRLELAKAREDCEHLKRLVLESETKELNSKQKLQASRMDLEELEKFKHEVEELRLVLADYRLQEQDVEQARDERNHLRNELANATLKLGSLDAERERTMKTYERHIVELEAKLQGLNPSGSPGQLPQAVQQMVDSALAASNAKLQHLKKAHSRLHDKYIELEIRCHELERERSLIAGRTGTSISHSHSPTSHSRPDEIFPFPFKRSSTPTSSSYSATQPVKPQPLSTEHLSEDDDYYRTHYTPSSPMGESFSSMYNPPARPVRLESLKHMGGFSPGEPKMLSPIKDTSSQQDSPVEYERSLDYELYQPRVGSDKRSSRGKDSISLESVESGEKDKKKEKIGTKSQVRVYGRGGAQNIGKSKEKSKDKDSDKNHKTGTFRGLRGIM